MIEEFYSEKLKQLKLSNIDNPELSLRLIINKSRNKDFNFPLNLLKIEDLNLKKFNNIFCRMIKGEPLSKIFNVKEFFSLDFITNQNVFDPRPETEFIIEFLIKKFDNKNKKLSICDLGTGTGCIIITLLKNFIKSSGVGIDISKHAINIAKKNSQNHFVNNRLKLINSNWKLLDNKFDIIISNPPYIKLNDYYNLPANVRNYDPKNALLGGETGLEKYKDLAPIVYRCMKESSIFLTEIGIGQKKEVSNIFSYNKLILQNTILDLQGIERILVFKKCQVI